MARSLSTSLALEPSTPKLTVPGPCSYGAFTGSMSGGDGSLAEGKLAGNGTAVSRYRARVFASCEYVGAGEDGGELEAGCGIAVQGRDELEAEVGAVQLLPLPRPASAHDEDASDYDGVGAVPSLPFRGGINDSLQCCTRDYHYYARLVNTCCSKTWATCP